MDRVPLRHIGIESSRCYACAPGVAGLHMQFYWIGDRVEAEWTAGDQAEGWAGLVHGSIFAALHDEAAAWAMIMIAATTGFTTQMDVRYRLPIRVGDRVIVRGRLVERTPRKGVFATEILLADGENIASTATVEYSLIDDVAFLERVMGKPLSPAFREWMAADADGKRALIARQAQSEGTS